MEQEKANGGCYRLGLIGVQQRELQLQHCGCPVTALAQINTLTE